MYVCFYVAIAPLSADKSVKSFIYSSPNASLGLLLRRKDFMVVSADGLSNCVEEVCELYAYDARHSTDEDARLCECEVAEIHDVFRVYVWLGDVTIIVHFSD